MQRTHRAVAVAVAVALAGCTPRPRFTTGYEVDRVTLRAEPINASLAVKQFQDQRPPRVYTSPAGRLMLLYIPGIPYVSIPFERLDESIRMLQMEDPEQYTYPVGMAQAIADDLRATGLFKEVMYVGEGSAAGHRYVLTGTLRETPVHPELMEGVYRGVQYVDGLQEKTKAAA